MTTPEPKVEPARPYANSEVSESVRALALRRQSKVASGDAIFTGIDFIDSKNPPLTRGDLSVIVGLTSEGKSMLATSIIKHTVSEITSGKRGVKSAVVIVLTEETTETRRIQLWGDHRVTIRGVLTGTTSLEAIDYNIAKSANEPIYFIGDCSGAPIDPSDETMGALTPRKIAASLQFLVSIGIMPELVVIDHVHDLATEKVITSEADTYETVARQLVQLTGWLRHYCPMIAVAQAKKEVMQRQNKDRMPTKYDLKFMSALAARARDIHTLWYPTYHMEEGQKLMTSQGETTVSKGLFVASLAKGRYAEVTGKSYPLTAIDEHGNWSGMLREMKIKK